MKVASRARVLAGCKHISTPSLRGIRFNTNNEIWLMADDLTNRVDAGVNTADVVKSRGLKYEPHGLLWNLALRDVHQPIDHYLRDWMHILVSGGTANRQAACLAKAMKAHNIPTSIIQTYSLGRHAPQQVRQGVSGLDSSCEIRGHRLVVLRVTNVDVGPDHRGVPR